jgi:tousled-like kinase
MSTGLPFDVKSAITNANASNQDRIALLERRFGIPPSPAGSKDVDTNQNSNSSCPSSKIITREETPAASIPEPGSNVDQQQAHSRHLQLLNNNNNSKKRRSAEPQQGIPLKKSPANNNITIPSPRPSLSPYLNDNKQPGGGANNNNGGTPGSRQKQITINCFFPNINSNDATFPDISNQQQQQKQQQQPPAGGEGSPPYNKALEEETRALKQYNTRLQAELDKAQQLAAEMTTNVQRLEQEAAESQQQLAHREGSVRSTLLRLATTAARQQRDLTHVQLLAAAPRLGSLGVRRCGLDVQEVWEEGSALQAVRTRMAALTEQRDSVEAARKAAKRRLPLPGQPIPTQRAADGASASPTSTLHPDDYVVQEEVWKVRLQALRREEESLRGELSRLEAEKMAYLKQVKLSRDEEGSRFNDFPVLNNRYLLLNMLGKGGFSEVYKAMDLVDLQEVACKIHQLNSQWSEVKKASYVKHSVREYKIHKNLHHPKIVSLLDIFEIDNNTFATVLQLADGGDLDSYIKQHETLPEREAKAIMAQVLSGLTYLNTKPRSVIHYDLKPANILFDRNGEVKLTDFGLSKIVDDGHTQMGMELTSQGAGTYWYLPPECFEHRKTPMINNKVDIWSVGVIFYQLLFGKRPFGHDQSQEQILRNEVMLHAKEVGFPTKPAVSDACKDFIRQCLAYKQEDRLDVHAAANHAYMSFKKQDRRSSNAAAAGGGGGGASAQKGE